jgi:hypothetical protein
MWSFSFRNKSENRRTANTFDLSMGEPPILIPFNKFLIRGN